MRGQVRDSRPDDRAEVRGFVWLRHVAVGCLLFLFSVGPIWPASVWLASAFHIRWAGTPLLSQPTGSWFMLTWCLAALCIGAVGRWVGLIVMGRFFRRSDVVPVVSLGGPDPLARIDAAIYARFYRR